MVYQWKESFCHKMADVEKVKEELDSIDVITPENIVKSAEDNSLEIHKCFTWDNETAGEKWRMQEARQLISSIVIITEKEDEEIKYRAFESVVIDDQKQYKQIEKVLSDEELYSQIMADITHSINELRKKVSAYKYLSSKLFDRIDDKLQQTLEIVHSG